MLFVYFLNHPKVLYLNWLLITGPEDDKKGTTLTQKVGLNQVFITFNLCRMPISNYFQLVKVDSVMWDRVV